MEGLTFTQLQENNAKLVTENYALAARLEKAESQLAELAAQEPYQIDNLEHFIAFWRKVSTGQIKPGKNEIDQNIWFLESLAQTELFTRATCAVPFVVSKPGTKCIGWVRDAIHEHDAKWIEAIKAAGGSVVE